MRAERGRQLLKNNGSASARRTYRLLSGWVPRSSGFGLGRVASCSTPKSQTAGTWGWHPCSSWAGCPCHLRGWHPCCRALWNPVNRVHPVRTS